MGLQDQSMRGPKSWTTFLNPCNENLCARIESASVVSGAAESNWTVRLPATPSDAISLKEIFSA